MYLEDSVSGNRTAIVTDRSEGGSSLNDGEMELMLHRYKILVINIYSQFADLSLSYMKVVYN